MYLMFISFRFNSDHVLIMYYKHFVRTSEFVDDLEDIMDEVGLDFANASDERDQETQDILDSEEGENDYDNEL